MSSHQDVCIFLKGLPWHTYQYLEKRMLDLSRYVTFDPQNRSTWSESLADLLMLCGSALDTFFRNMLYCPNIQREQSYKKINKTHNKFNILDFINIYEPYYELSQNIVEVPFGLGKNQRFQPFKEFTNGRPPIWWDAYNHIKHDYYESLEEANLGNVLECLGGLLIVHLLHKCSQKYLIQTRRLVGAYSETPFYLLEIFGRSKVGYPKDHYLIMQDTSFMTPIFVFKFRSDPNPNLIGPLMYE